LPLLKRKAAVERELRRSGRIVYTQHIGEDGTRLFETAAQLGLEGIVAKRANSPCMRGRSHNWIKVKTPAGRAFNEERAKWNE
jgi:bifunctional non-homologous end joining protein LigD